MPSPSTSPLEHVLKPDGGIFPATRARVAVRGWLLRNHMSLVENMFQVLREESNKGQTAVRFIIPKWHKAIGPLSQLLMSEGYEVEFIQPDMLVMQVVIARPLPENISEVIIHPADFMATLR